MGIIDENAFLARFASRPDLQRRAILAFIAQAPGLLDHLREAMAGEDPQTVSRAAHKIKGSVSYFCAPSVLNIAASLQNAGDQNQMVEALQPLADELAAKVRQLVSALEGMT